MGSPPRRALSSLVCAVGLVTGGCASGPSTGDASAGSGTPSAELRTVTTEAVAAATTSALVAELVVEAESPREGYERELFDHWVDVDGDGCSTRCEVLERERRVDLPGLPGGGWLSAYDGYSTDDPDELQVDHVVALAEAWDSGARTWGEDRRRAFANDLGVGALTAVTAATNQAKGAEDPATWQPSNTSAWCSYATAWVTTKLRWSLTADPAEVAALANMAAGCDGAPTTAAPAPTTTAGPADGSDPGAQLPWPDCAAARAAGATPVHEGTPGYGPHLDGDRDGIGCEGPSPTSSPTPAPAPP